MKKASATSPEVEQSDEIPQERPDEAPAGWVGVQDEIAAETGVAVLLVDGYQPPALVVSNNNSICHAFQSSRKHVRLCDPYCGIAHQRAMSAGSAVQYKCHAGLHCFTMPVQVGGENLAAIGGRAFTSAADYRSLIDRFRGGELNELLASEPFDNVIFAEPERLNQLSERLQKAARKFGQFAETVVSAPGPRDEAPKPADKNPSNVESEVVLRTTTEPAKRAVEAVSAGLDLSADATDDSGMFAIGSDPELQAELKRLRKRVHQSNFTEYLGRLSDRIDLPDPAQTYKEILAVVKELLKAERASIMIFDEAANEIVLKESEGLARGEGEVTKINVGEGIAGEVFKSEKARVIDNLEQAGFTLAPAERNYKTKSFLSWPIISKHGLKLGVLNVADKVDGGKFQTIDLGMLEVIAQPIAAAVERAILKEHSLYRSFNWSTKPSLSEAASDRRTQPFATLQISDELLNGRHRRLQVLQRSQRPPGRR